MEFLKKLLIYILLDCILFPILLGFTTKIPILSYIIGICAGIVWCWVFYTRKE